MHGVHRRLGELLHAFGHLRVAILLKVFGELLKGGGRGHGVAEFGFVGRCVCEGFGFGGGFVPFLRTDFSGEGCGFAGVFEGFGEGFGVLLEGLPGKGFGLGFELVLDGGDFDEGLLVCERGRSVESLGQFFRDFFEFGLVGEVGVLFPLVAEFFEGGGRGSFGSGCGVVLADAGGTGGGGLGQEQCSEQGEGEGCGEEVLFGE